MEQLKSYVQESFDELLHKVTWPTWEEIQESTVIVIIATLIIAGIIFLMDFIFGANPENSIFKGILYYIYQIFA